MKKNKKTSVRGEVIFLVIAVILGAILLIANSVYSFLNLYLFIGLIVLEALCAASIIAMAIIKKKMNSYIEEDNDEYEHKK